MGPARWDALSVDAPGYDLDLADVAEVRRRVVDPVLAQMFRPGELDLAELTVGPPNVPSGWGTERDHAPELEVTLQVGEEDCSIYLGHVTLYPWNARELARDLADRLSDEICESSFGWGQLRELRAGFVPAPAAEGPAGARQLHVLITAEGGLPLWEAGRPADVEGLGLSAALRRDLRAWQALVAAGPDAPDHVPGPPPTVIAASSQLAYSSTLSLETAEQRATREGVEHDNLARARSAWRRYVGLIEPARDALVVRLRAELGPTFHIPTAPRIP